MLQTIGLVILQSFYFILPAYGANMMPVIFAKLNWLNCLAKPIDNGKLFAGQEIFGSHKTWRGLVVGVLGGIIVAGGQALLQSTHIGSLLSLNNYSDNWLLFGFLGGAGALLGDLLKSFFKRRFRITSGSAWPIFDQLDFIVGFFLLTIWLFNPGWLIIMTIFGLTVLLHPLTNIIAFFLGIKKVWW